jgi:hypothetical protein
MFRVDGLDGELQQGSADQVKAVYGTSLALGGGFWFTQWFGAIAQGGGDLVWRPVRYTVRDETVMYLGIARPSLLLGLALRLSVRKDKRHGH